MLLLLCGNNPHMNLQELARAKEERQALLAITKEQRAAERAAATKARKAAAAAAAAEAAQRFSKWLSCMLLDHSNVVANSSKVVCIACRPPTRCFAHHTLQRAPQCCDW